MSDKGATPQANGKSVINGLPVYEHKSDEVPNNVRKRKVDQKGSDEAQGKLFLKAGSGKIFSSKFKHGIPVYSTFGLTVVKK